MLRDSPAPPSINTLLLHVFRTLAAAGRSFSVGDLALEDQGLYDAIIRAGGTPPSSFCFEWSEYTLKLPLTDQCTCTHCKTKSVPKEAIEFRVVGGKYLQVRPKQFASSSFTGILEMLRTSLGAAGHTVPNCHNRTVERTPYSFGPYDEETYALICKGSALAVAENEAYGRAGRSGNEFFVPSEVVAGVRRHTI